MRFVIILIVWLAIFSAPSALAGNEAEESGAGWYPSEFGADDRLGAINNIDAAKTLQAAGLVTDSEVLDSFHCSTIST